MDINQVEYDFGEITDDKFKTIKESRIQCLNPEMFDYTVGNSSLRYEYIKDIENKDERLNQMIEFVKELTPKGLPDEFYDWFARECLGLQYTKYEINYMKREYRIARKREITQKKKDKKKQEKVNKKRINIENKKVVLNF